MFADSNYIAILGLVLFSTICFFAYLLSQDDSRPPPDDPAHS